MSEEQIFKNMNKFEDNLSIYACKNSDGIRLKDASSDFRPSFFRDIDRIIYSLSYTRYTDKTQVFTFNEDDHISRRMTHVQMVSKIARTIGRALGLNEDLIEAASLGHDLGHVPFGHVGEAILNRISLKNNEGYFNHNIQSVRTLMHIENGGRGKNLTLQTLDAIMCHNGEFLMGSYYPKSKTWDNFFNEYNDSYSKKDFVKKLIPMTLEGCVVRISDTIAYIGKDIEDAIRLGLLSTDDVPSQFTDILGKTNKDIVNTITMDVINNSIGKDYLTMSTEVFEALRLLKEFNFSHIYIKANTKKELIYYEKIMNDVFENCLKDLEINNIESNIYKVFLIDMDDEYMNNTSKERIVLDYIAGMTDEFIHAEYKKISNTNKVEKKKYNK